MNAMPLILDFDDTAGPLDGATVIPLQDWQERIRFGCSLGQYDALRRHLAPLWPSTHGTVLMGSGDYHHLSWLLIERLRHRGPFDVVVFDNHPDNMRFPFGIHCGSWVRKVALMPEVRHVHVLGIGSADISAGHAWENHWWPLWRHKLSYWCLDVDVGWAGKVGLGHAFHRFTEPAALIEGFLARLPQGPVYLSIDKDVFAPEVVRTNWDQGRLTAADVERVIAALSGRLIGSDITGEVSVWPYRTWWKRKLSALDAQPAIPAAQLAAWQADQQALNRQLLAAIGRATMATTPEGFSLEPGSQREQR